MSAASRNPQNLRAVVADGGNVQSALAKLFRMELQLHELSFAERSPIGGAEEDKHYPLGPLTRRSCASGRSDREARIGIFAPTSGRSRLRPRAGLRRAEA